MVSARDAADYLLSLAARLDGKPARDAIMPAALADSAVVSPQLLAIARDQSRSREARRSALSWLGRDVGRARRHVDRARRLGAWPTSRATRATTRRCGSQALSRCSGSSAPTACPR
jgi:hypothetical protein